MTVLETERLVLRPVTEADLDPYAAMCADPEVMRYISPGSPVPRTDAWRHIATMRGHQEFRGYSLSAVIEKTTGRFIGRGGLWRPEGWPGLEIGWALARHAWGHGYATELAQASLAYAFNELGADEVISLIVPENTRSIAVAERIGHTHLRDTEVLDTLCRVYGQTRPD